MTAKQHFSANGKSLNKFYIMNCGLLIATLFTNQIHYLCPMGNFPKKLKAKLNNRATNNALRDLPVLSSSEGLGLVDFSSNDYLGFAKNLEIFEETAKILSDKGLTLNGATGSRLLSGNNALYLEIEEILAQFHKSKSALVFNSGYDANIGFFSAVPQRGDLIFYDEYIHASIRDGIKMGNVKSYKFKHNSFEGLQKIIERSRNDMSKDCEIYIVTESVFSMDGDSPDLETLVTFCNKNSYHLVVDEAHAVGVLGCKGGGLLQELGLQDTVFARIITFGKAMGCHGAVILGSGDLKKYLINFARSFIYTTALPPHSLTTIMAAYNYLSMDREGEGKRDKLHENITYFRLQLKILSLATYFIQSNSAIHCCIVPGNEKVKAVAKEIKVYGFDVKPILSPTVAKGQERLRFCLHAYNTKEEIKMVLEVLVKLI